MPVRQPAMGDGRHLAGVRGFGDSGHLAFNRLHRDILRDLADSTRYKWKTESMSRRRSYGGAMNGGSGAHCYIVLGRNTMNGGHRETEKLTARSTATVAASEKAPMAWVDGGGGWREKWRTGEDEFEQTVTKT